MLSAKPPKFETTNNQTLIQKATTSKNQPLNPLHFSDQKSLKPLLTNTRGFEAITFLNIWIIPFQQNIRSRKYELVLLSLIYLILESQLLESLNIFTNYSIVSWLFQY